MKVLFIGGTGIISTACTKLAAQHGIELYLLNRGQHDIDLPAGVRILRGDIRDPAAADKALEDHTFDVVVNWIAFTPEHIETDLRLFAGKIGQYVFISSASAYQKPVTHLPITESTPLANPWWQYSRDKIACEERLMREYRDHGFPFTVVRPSHTYGQTLIPVALGGKTQWTIPDRMIRGKPVIVPGDGTSLWVLTHNSDFAKAFVGLLGHPQAIGHAFHITGDQVLTWNQVYQAIGTALGVEPKLVHLSADQIIAVNPSLVGPLLGDKCNSVIFDNTKVKRFVPDYAATKIFAQGVRESIAWHRADKSRQTIDEEHNQFQDELIARYQAAFS